MPLRAIVVDFNSYFASCEQQLRPELRGKPVAVVPVNTDSTCCIAASYEAKRFGVKTGTGVGDAKQMCPGLIVVEGRPELYVELHERLVAVIEDCIHVERVMSIDEMGADLTGKLQDRGRAVELARKIKREISSKVGTELRCSIGIAPNHYLAKTASDMQKPDGLVVIEQEELPQILHRLELRDLCGIGRNMELRLHQHGIRTVEQLCAATKEELREAWGSIEGERMHQDLRGEIVYRPPERHSSIGHSHVLPPEERNEKDAFAVLNRLLQKAAMRLRKMGYYAGGMHVSVRHVRQSRWGDECRFTETQDTVELLHALRMLWERRPGKCPAPMKVGVVLSNLVEEANRTPSFFEKNPRKQLNAGIDKINSLFGNNTIYFAGAHSARKSAPLRIAFSRVPDLKTEADGKELPPEHEARLAARRSRGKAVPRRGE
ncbi:MAG TPA: hypothetical protein VG733_14470 [Chthoniobacteraceae bacterium]|nr:hypothetical protein [Chthoniobacteraceae bacterium]